MGLPCSDISFNRTNAHISSVPRRNGCDWAAATQCTAAFWRSSDALIAQLPNNLTIAARCAPRLRQLRATGIAGRTTYEQNGKTWLRGDGVVRNCHSFWCAPIGKPTVDFRESVADASRKAPPSLVLEFNPQCVGGSGMTA